MNAREVAEEIVSTGVAPSAAAGAARRVDAAWVRDLGGDEGTFFDLASLTKPMTAVAVVLAGIAPETPLAALLPEVAATPAASTTIEALLAHRAGLEAHIDVWDEMAAGMTRTEALVRVARARRADARADGGTFAPLYSDLGYVLAGEALARAVGVVDAGEAIERLVVKPLGLRGALGTARALEAAVPDFRNRAAPTEIVAWRGGEVRGRVHDENAWALTREGGSGHAGMFGTVSAVHSFVEAFVDALDGIAGAPLRGDFAWLVRPRGPRDVPGGTLRAGFDGKSAEGSSAGTRIGVNAFGHLGFTGTSFWVDPDAKIVVSLLTNRVHPTRDHVAIRAARPRAHDALFARAQTLSSERP